MKENILKTQHSRCNRFGYCKGDGTQFKRQRHILFVAEKPTDNLAYSAKTNEEPQHENNKGNGP
jgi:hypothetical protein